jgi:cytochrome c oxidase subunit 3
VGFLGVKGLEYKQDLDEHLFPGPHFSIPEAPKAELFFYLYWAMTGLHGLHVLIGIGLLSVIAFLAHRRRFSAEYHNPVEVSGLYWHFVDIVWLFLYPLLYLVDRHL